MDNLPGSELMNYKKELVDNSFLLAEYVKICAYRYLWNTSDTNFKNILYHPESKSLFSIDEMRVFEAKDKGVFGKCEKKIKEIISKELDKEKSLVKLAIEQVESLNDKNIKEALELFGYSNYEYVIKRRDNLLKTIREELYK